MFAAAAGMIALGPDEVELARWFVAAGAAVTSLDSRFVAKLACHYSVALH